MDPYILLQYLALFVCILIVMPVHEFFHAFAAVKCGDETPRYSGRYTLNPMKHFDPLGILMMLVARFGWAKPVPINPGNFINYKKGMFWVSVSGVLSNFAMAFICYPIYLLSWRYLPDLLLFDDFIKLFFYFMVNFNISLFVFNLLPIFPLDGFRLVETFSKTRNRYMDFMYRYGQFLLLGLILINIVADSVPILSYVDVFGYYMSYARIAVSWPISAFWGIFF